MRRFLDTNILVYAFEPADGTKQAAARSLIREAIADESFVISTQVLAEFYSTAVRRRLMQPIRALELARLWGAHDVVPQTPDLVVRSIALHQEHSLSFWDAQIVQAALDARCDLLLSEDMQHGRRFGALEVRNPFIATAAHEPGGAVYGIRRRGKGRRAG